MELLWFKVTCVDDEVKLAWETVSEVNTSGFILFRADNPTGEKEPIATINSLPPGNTEGKLYEYTDEDVTFGVPYVYWLEELDMDRNPKNIFGPERALWWHLYMPLTMGN